jgi:hypothetical protein
MHKQKEIISRERARYPGGEIKDRAQVPEVPPELISLQQARDAIFINARSQLLNQLGTAAFDEIDLRIKSIVSPNVKVISPR